MAKEIESRDDLTPDIRNANLGTERGRYMLDGSLRKLGAGRSIVVDAEGRVVAGNKTLEVAEEIDLPIRVVQTDGTELVVVQRTDWDLADNEGPARQYAYMDNRSSEIGLDWDAEQIAIDLGDGIDLDAMFGAGELEEIIGEALETREDPGAQIDKAAELQEKWQTERGQIWEIGDHRLMCGDSTNAEDVARLMGGEKAGAVVTDPPCGMGLDTDFSQLISAKTRPGQSHKYMPVIGDDKPFDASSFISIGPQEQFWFGADYYVNTLPGTGRKGSWYVWDKRLDETLDRMYGSCFELIWSRQAHKRDILRHRWAGRFTGGENREFSHPTEKPVSLIIALVGRTKGAGIIVDWFLGSGTTMVAAEQLGRVCYGMEISEAYTAVCLERMLGMGLEPQPLV